MPNPLNDIAVALLFKATALPAIVDGRTGEGGNIPRAPYVEVGDGRGSITPYTAGAGGLDEITVQFYVIVYERFNGANPATQKELLRGVAWDYYTALKTDPSLGGLCDEARVNSFDADLTKRNNVDYWFMALEVAVRLEANA